MDGHPVPILCVDDEPNVLAGLNATLGRRFAVQVAASGLEGLAQLRRRPATAVILSDMRMPGMDGATFLRLARDAAPGAVRLLLTGQADLGGAAAAVNEGEIFRLLVKPCPSDRLVSALDAAAQRAREAAAERALLEQTLRGSVTALVEVLAVTQPAAFDRGRRLRGLATELAGHAGLAERWQLGAAAMLSQLGAIALPADVEGRRARGEPPAPDDAPQLERSRETAARLLGAIPSLVAVRELLDGEPAPVAGRGGLGRERALLRLALDYEALEERGLAAGQALDVLRGRAGRYDPALLESLAEVLGEGAGREDVRELPVFALRAGMVLLEDLRSRSGVLLAPRGLPITGELAERARRFGGPVQEPIRVRVPAAQAG